MLRSIVVACQMIFAALGGASLVGCAGSLENYIASPSPSSIFDYAKIFEEKAGVKIRTFADYVFAGIIYVDDQCESFFNELEIQKREIAFYNSVSNKALTGTVALLPSLTKKATKAQAVLGALAGLASAAFEQYDKQYNFAPYSVQLRRLTLQSQDTLKRTMIPPEWFKTHIVDVLPNKKFGVLVVQEGENPSALSLLFLAHHAVQQYAKTCTIPQMQLFIETALNVTNAEQSDAPDSGKNRQKSSFNKDNTRGGVMFSSPPFVAR
jgi:hypothetical protein